MKLCQLLALALAPLAAFPASAAESGAAQQQAAARIVNRIAATVNGRPITASEVRQRLAPYMRELMVLYPQQGPRFTAELVKAKKQVLSELIDRELVLSEFETKGYQMKESQVDDEISRRILVTHNGDREAFLEGLRKSGMTISEYREAVRKEITVAAMRSSRYERDIPPTPDEIRAEYNASKSDFRDISQDSIRYEKIYIPSIPEDATITSREEQMEVAQQQYNLSVEVRKKLDSGELSFAEAARTYSKDLHAKDGGKWPSIKRKDLAVEFAHIVFSSEPGKIMGPLLDQGGLGFTIVRVIGKDLAPAPPLSNPEVKEQVDDAVRRKQSEKRYREWVNRLRSRAIIRTFI